MKITQPNSNQLILEHQPISIWLFAGVFGVIGIWLLFHTGNLFGIIFVAVSVFIAVSMGQVVTCVFDKATDQFTIKRQGLFGTQVVQHRIRDISNVHVVQQSDQDGDKTYQVKIILTTGKSIPLVLYSSSGRQEEEETADRIRAFLNLNYSAQPSQGSRHQARPSTGAASPYPPDLPDVTVSQTNNGLSLTLTSNISWTSIQRLIRKLPPNKMLVFMDPKHRGPLNEPDGFCLAKRGSDYIMMSQGERWSSYWTPIEEAVLTQYFVELSKPGSCKVSVSDYRDFSDGSRPVESDPNADPAHFVRNRVAEALEEDAKMAEQSEMTPELWQKLDEIAQQPVVVLSAHGEPTPGWIRCLNRMGYLDVHDWGAGSQGEAYGISAQGRRAIAAYRSGQA